jgi:hypothetical protein
MSARKLDSKIFKFKSKTIFVVKEFKWSEQIYYSASFLEFLIKIRCFPLLLFLLADSFGADCCSVSTTGGINKVAMATKGY